MCMSTSPLFSRPVGAYRRLDSFTLATIIQTETWRFCREFLCVQNDPKGRWFDQMTQAARSGRANIAEGSENSATSKETELKLLGIARGSLAELLADYEMWLAFAGVLPWSRKEAEEVHSMQLDPFPESSEEGLLRTSALHSCAQRAKFGRWLDSSDPCVRANCLMVLVLRAMTLLRRQMEYLGEEFARHGGLREQMSATRRAVRNGVIPIEPSKTPSDAPSCPECGRPMRRRIKRATGEEFWGCTAFEQGCRGTRPIE